MTYLELNGPNIEFTSRYFDEDANQQMLTGLIEAPYS